MLHKLIIGAIGIYMAYITMSLLSEQLFNKEFEHTDPSQPKAKFTFPPVMVWSGCFLCFIAGKIISKINKEPQNPVILKEQVLMGGLFAVNMVTTNYALLYISYPVQVIGRNIRFLFVVLIGAFFSRLKKTNSDLKLGKHKIVIASIITIGVILFNIAKLKNDRGDKHDPQYLWIGYLLLGISVVVDALFSDSQAYSKASFKPTANHLFTTTNFYCFVFCLLFSILGDGSFLPALEFLSTHPQALIEILLIGVLQILGQISIYYIVSNFKQHIFPLIATTRKILTVILSIFVFKHDVTFYQWVAIGIVFFGMLYEFYEQLMKQKAKDQKKGQKVPDSDSSQRQVSVKNKKA